MYSSLVERRVVYLLKAERIKFSFVIPLEKMILEYMGIGKEY